MKIKLEFDSFEEFEFFCKTREAVLKEGAAPTACQPAKPVDVWKEEAAPMPEPVEDPVPFAEDLPQAPEGTEEMRVEIRRMLAQLNRKTGENTASKLIKSLGYEKLTQVALKDLPKLQELAKEALDAE